MQLYHRCWLQWHETIIFLVQGKSFFFLLLFFFFFFTPFVCQNAGFCCCFFGANLKLLPKKQKWGRRREWLASRCEGPGYKARPRAGPRESGLWNQAGIGVLVATPPPPDPESSSADQSGLFFLTRLSRNDFEVAVSPTALTSSSSLLS